MPEFYMKIVLKIFFSIFCGKGGGARAPSPVSYAFDATTSTQLFVNV